MIFKIINTLKFGPQSGRYRHKESFLKENRGFSNKGQMPTMSTALSSGEYFNLKCLKIIMNKKI
jgi:hypothetical protein